LKRLILLNGPPGSAGTEFYLPAQRLFFPDYLSGFEYCERWNQPDIKRTHTNRIFSNIQFNNNFHDSFIFNFEKTALINFRKQAVLHKIQQQRVYRNLSMLM